MASPQLSLAVNVSAVGTASHSTSTSAGKASLKVGAVVSSIVKTPIVISEFPQASVAVKVTVAEPVAPHSSESSVKLFDQVKIEQSSLAIAPP